MKNIVILLILLPFLVAAQDLQKVSIKSKNTAAITYSPDNQYLAFARGNSIELYNAGTDTRIKDFSGDNGHSRGINHLVFNRASTLLASGSNDKTLKLWAIPSGEVKQTLKGASAEILDLRFTNDDKHILALSSDNYVRMWDAESGSLVYSVKIGDKAARAFDVSGDGKYFAVGGGDKNIVVCNADDGSVKKTITGHKDWVRSVKFAPDMKTLASSGDDKNIIVWDIEAGSKQKEFPQKGWIYDLHYSQDGKYLGAALEKSSVAFYNLTTGILALKIDDFVHPVTKLAISAGGKEASTIEEFGTEIKVWNIESLNISPVYRFKDAKDTSAPLVMISNPPNIVDNKVRVYKDLLDLRGIVTDESGVRTLKINGRETPVKDNGNFVFNIPLTMGENFINIEVTDINDNIALRKFVVTRKSAEGEEYNPAVAKNFLLVIGINNYAFWPKLNNAVKDVNDIAGVLMSRYNFDFANITILKDEQATRSNIYNSLRSLIEKVSPQDNLIVYFSGHGFFDDLLSEGYWIPVEAHVGSSGDYISNTEILKILGNINSQHTFLVADACFSGALFADARRGYTENVEKFRSRWGLTSGRLEVVSDGATGTNSPFATHFISFMKNNTKSKFAVSELVQYVKTQVAEETKQTPLGNPLKTLGDEGGEFVFYLKN
jgi:WD40 repeat protein